MVKIWIYTGLDSKKKKVCLREKEVYKNMWKVIYFGAMLFEVQTQIFCASDNFADAFADFCFIVFTQVLVKELAYVLIHIHKIFICRAFSKCSCQRAS